MVKNQPFIRKVTQEFVKVLVSLCCSGLPVTVSHRERSVEWAILYALAMSTAENCANG